MLPSSSCLAFPRPTDTLHNDCFPRLFWPKIKEREKIVLLKFTYAWIRSGPRLSLDLNLRMMHGLIADLRSWSYVFDI